MTYGVADVDVDVAIIDGGPAGSTAATLLAQQGLRVSVFERERFPRFHIGESLIPETYWVLQRLNMLPKMQQSHFVKKYSVQFVNAAGKQSAPFYFWDNKPHECSQTWQVVRSEFDQMMLDNAREHGVDVHEATRVIDVLFEGDRAVGVTVQSDDGSIREVRAKVVVDASGQIGLLQNGFRLRVWDPTLTKDYSYRATENAGDGWVMIGDSYAFLAPLYSSGVLLALRSGEMAADAIVDGLGKGDPSGAQLGRWKAGYDQGVDRMRRLVCEYYDGFSFGQFVRNYPHLRGTVTDLLIGDLFTDEVDKVWGPMESLYPGGKAPIPAWNDAPRPAAEAEAPRERELSLPDGHKR